MTARQHHYVPQCYLKGFVANRGKPKLFVVDAKERRSFSTSPINVAVERDFHRIDIDGHALDALENAFSQFETDLNQALKRIVTARSIKDDNDRALLFNLIGLMATKNPRLRENFRVAYEHMERIIMDLATSTPELWASQVRLAQKAGFIAANADTDYKKMRESVEREEYKVKIMPSMHLRMELQTFDKILPYLFNRKWILFRAPPKTTGFITSDHPMCLTWSNMAQCGGSYPPGLGLRKTQLLFPISNELAAIGAFEIENGEIDADDLLIPQINGSIIRHSMRQIYARDSNFLYRMQHNADIMHGASLLDDQCFSRPK